MLQLFYFDYINSVHTLIRRKARGWRYLKIRTNLNAHVCHEGGQFSLTSCISGAKLLKKLYSQNIFLKKHFLFIIIRNHLINAISTLKFLLILVKYIISITNRALHLA